MFIVTYVYEDISANHRGNAPIIVDSVELTSRADVSILASQMEKCVRNFKILSVERKGEYENAYS